MYKESLAVENSDSKDADQWTAVKWQQAKKKKEN